MASKTVTIPSNHTSEGKEFSLAPHHPKFKLNSPFSLLLCFHICLFLCLLQKDHCVWLPLLCGSFKETGKKTGEVGTNTNNKKIRALWSFVSSVIVQSIQTLSFLTLKFCVLLPLPPWHRLSCGPLQHRGRGFAISDNSTSRDTVFVCAKCFGIWSKENEDSLVLLCCLSLYISIYIFLLWLKTKFYNCYLVKEFRFFSLYVNTSGYVCVCLCMYMYSPFSWKMPVYLKNYKNGSSKLLTALFSKIHSVIEQNVSGCLGVNDSSRECRK